MKLSQYDRLRSMLAYDPTLSTADIARALGVSRQRAWQIRNPVTYGPPPPAAEPYEFHLPRLDRGIPVPHIKRIVCAHYELTKDAMIVADRRRVIAWPRQVAMMLVREYTTFSYPWIGHLFGGRDHTTVLHACRAVQRRMARSAAYGRDVETIAEKIRTSAAEVPHWKAELLAVRAIGEGAAAFVDAR